MLVILNKCIKDAIESGQIGNVPSLEGRNFKKSKRSRSKELGTAVKIVSPKQILACLSILLAQIEAENNSQQLTNEIRQLLYWLYRSKNINKSI